MLETSKLLTYYHYIPNTPSDYTCQRYIKSRFPIHIPYWLMTGARFCHDDDSIVGSNPANTLFH